MEDSRAAVKAGHRAHTTASAAYELTIFALTILSLVVMAGYFLLPKGDPTRDALFYIDFLLGIVFLADSFYLLFRAPDKKAYLRWGWLDFLGSVPSFIPLRIFRIARLVRAWRVVRSRNARQILGEFKENRAAGTLLTVVFVALLLLTIGSLVVLRFESRAPDANIDSGAEAVWWALVTVATVGYGDYYPVTGPGRITAILLMLVGVGFFGALSSYLVSTFVADERAKDKDADPTDESLSNILDEMAGLKAEVAALREQLQSGTDNHKPPD
ncbi:ion transporter [Chloroflexota bacterium]